MANYDFQNDIQNEAAKKNYDAAMNGEKRKGIDLFEKPHLWDEERPCDIKDSPRENFVPIPTIGTGDSFSGYSTRRKVFTILGICAVVILLAVCVVTFFMDGGFSQNPARPILP